MTAARAGAKVLLVERNGYLGGQLGSGLPFLAFLDRKQRQVIFYYKVRGAIARPIKKIIGRK